MLQYSQTTDHEENVKQQQCQPRFRSFLSISEKEDWVKRTCMEITGQNTETRRKQKKKDVAYI